MIAQEFRVLGNFVGTFRGLSELMDLHHRGRVSVTVRRYLPEKVAQGVGDLRSARVPGRAVLVP